MLRSSFTIGLALLLTCSTASSYEVPRLANGQPDFQGNWARVNATPLERPKGFTSLEITPEQALEIEATINAFLEDRSIPNDPTEFFAPTRVEPVGGQLRSSIIVDPADGRIPGTELFRARFARVRPDILNAMDGPEQRPTSERCLGSPTSQPPHVGGFGGANLHQIVQSDDTFMFFSEILNAARLVRLNGQHSSARVTSWLGDSIGHWEGDTLVVETRHFTASDTARAMPFAVFFVSPHTVVTERFTRVSADELNYVFTVEDPTYYTRRWTGETIFRRTHELIFEYACHEANRSLTYILQGGRANDSK